ncbi:3,4-dihydroxy-2-butanone-4-phosphate synthase [Leeia sp. TBRC 13508]|uniref:3,4-dihydroxy-2-butanone 4-phosphate synthase n=1 Tax=Leeia speluncae TaxID=2884804 RepID=A0ABS8D2P5_9NEIS|nr:bifunctional 3,4-dihydroxy-2-butanone-4-phosphate synthase/GTP cyclohydrolase II [Leeia speluncae]MCB6182468.1 3,4-dihydroxy-2-butanone-4-phosphate synthase [Leeia speluncae]
MYSIASVQEIIQEIRAGRMVVLVDEEDRENEGDLVMAAEFVTPEAINFMAKYGRGLICLTLTEERVDQLQLSMMAARNGTQYGTAFTVSIEAAEGVTTGISAADRSHTIRTAVARNAKATDIVQPGHVFPLRAQKGGVLVRAGHTEAGCDLARLAGLEPASVICEIMNDDGTMARLPELIEFAKEHNLKIGTIADLIHYRHQTESLVEKIADREITTPAGDFRLVAFKDTLSGLVQLSLVKGDISPEDDVLVRVHEPISVIDLLDIGQSKHSWALFKAMQRVQQEGKGVILLLHRPESGDELLANLFPQKDVRPAKWDAKTFGIGAQILSHLGVKRMKVMATPMRLASMTGFDLEVTGFLSPEE